MKKSVTVVAVLVALASGCGSSDGDNPAAVTESKTTVLEEAHDACVKQIQDAFNEIETDTKAEDLMTVGDDGETLSVQTGDNGEIVAAVTMGCVLSETGAPDSVNTDVSSTTALMGRQSAKWDDIEMTYSYHPDNGFTAVLTFVS